MAALVYVRHYCMLCGIVDAQLTTPTKAVCPGNRVSFICQQIGTPSQWIINLPSIILIQSVRSSQVGSIVTFQNDPGFDFKIHVISWNNASIRLTTELQVTAVRELNDVTVQCAGPRATFGSLLHISSSLGENHFLIIY